MAENISLQTLDKISNLLQNDNDLANIDSFISDIKKEKYTIDSQLTLEQERHLQQIHIMISNMQSANKNLQDLKYSVDKLDELRRDNLNSNNKNNNFQVFNQAALVMKNIKAVEELYTNISIFGDKQQLIMNLLDEELKKDESQELQFSTGDNLLIIHYELNKLRDLQDQMELMSYKSNLIETRTIVSNLQKELTECIKKFDTLLDVIVDSILDFVESGNFGFLIKVVKIIQYEEREDLKVRLWNHLLDKKKHNYDDNDDNHPDNRYSKIKRSKEREYKNKFELLFEKTIKDRFLDISESKDLTVFLSEEGKFYYQTIADYKVAIDKCFPNEWKFFPKILEWHQESIRDIIVSILENNQFSNIQLAEIIELDFQNKQILKQTFKLPAKYLKTIRLLSDEKKKQLLSNSLQENITSTTKWVETALDKSIKKFELLNEEPPERREDRLSFQVAQDIMLILSSNTKSIRTLGDASVLVQYFAFFANDIMRIYQERWVRSLDKMGEIWTNSRNNDNTKNSNNSIIPENIGYLPRYITNLSNDCLILTDALEKDFDSITNGLSETFAHQLIGLKEVATNHSIELGTYCLQKISMIALQDYSPIMKDLFSKSWYKSSTIIDSVLNIIDEEYIMPFIDFSYPELLISLFDFITDDFLLQYINMLNFKRTFDKKIVETLERDGHKIMEIFSKHDEDGTFENKMIIFDILIELISANNETEYIEKWNTALGEIFDLPVDLLRIILECKKLDKSRITFLMGEAEEICKQSISEHVDSPPSAFRKFIYSPIKK
jgi:hypothetical protein